MLLFFFLSGISYEDYRLATKRKKDLHFACARCFVLDNGGGDLLSGTFIVNIFGLYPIPSGQPEPPLLIIVPWQE